MRDEELSDYEIILMKAMRSKNALATIPALGHELQPGERRYKDMRATIEGLVKRKLALRHRTQGNTGFKLTTYGLKVLNRHPDA